MDGNIAADSAIAVSAMEDLRLDDETPSFRLLPVPNSLIPEWDRKVASWAAE